MKKLVLLSLILIFSAAASDAAYYNDDIPANAGSFTNQNTITSTTQISRIGNTYYTPSGTSYTRQGNDIYGSDGSHYTQFGNTIQSNSSRPKSYQINNNLIQPLY